MKELIKLGYIVKCVQDDIPSKTIRIWLRNAVSVIEWSLYSIYAFALFPLLLLKEKQITYNIHEGYLNKTHPYRPLEGFKV